MAITITCGPNSLHCGPESYLEHSEFFLCQYHSLNDIFFYSVTLLFHQHIHI